MKKVFIAFILTAALLLFGCEKEKLPDETKPVGVPDNTVARTEPVQPVTTDPVSDIDITIGVSQPGTDITSDNDSSDSVSQESLPSGGDSSAEIDNISIDDIESKAMDCLALLNSKKVHAKLVEAVSYDSEYVTSTDREYFIDGNNKVYLNDTQKIVMTNDEVYVIDLSDMTFYRYPRNTDDEGKEFGFEAELYNLVSYDTDEDGTVTEVYEIHEQNDVVKSTWTFFPGGKVTVADLSVEAGSYYWYSFDVIETDISEMDMAIPEGLTEIEPDDYF